MLSKYFLLYKKKNNNLQEEKNFLHQSRFCNFIYTYIFNRIYIIHYVQIYSDY